MTRFSTSRARTGIAGKSATKCHRCRRAWGLPAGRGAINPPYPHSLSRAPTSTVRVIALPYRTQHYAHMCLAAHRDRAVRNYRVPRIALALPPRPRDVLRWANLSEEVRSPATIPVLSPPAFRSPFCTPRPGPDRSVSLNRQWYSTHFRVWNYFKP